MTAIACQPIDQLHSQFLPILPRIERHARVYFRQFSPVKKEEAVADVIALRWKWFRRLVQRGKDEMVISRPNQPTILFKRVK
jgi:hypothetical protein